MRIRFNQELPRHVQVKQWVERQIAVGYWRSGDVLPPERVLANELGVSALTVIRALRSLAREGVLVRKRRVGTVFAEMVLGARGETRQANDFYYGVLQRSILGTLSEHGIRTLWLEYQFDQVERALHSGEIIGILAITPIAEHVPLLNRLYERGVPLVVVGASAQDWVLPSLDTDNYRSAFEGVNHLLELGHRRFLGLFGALETFNSRDRWRGFRDALRAAGIPSESIWTFTLPYAGQIDDDFRGGLATVLRLPERPTVIFAGGFYLALSAMQTLHQLGMRVPDDVSVLGYEDPPSASLAMPPLTTFRQPLEALGACAVQRLLELIKGHPPDPLHTYLPLELVIRGSTGHAPSV
ncbi:MAG: hypothetical protein C4337_07325 [Armatimonadota bacterium]